MMTFKPSLQIMNFLKVLSWINYLNKKPDDFSSAVWTEAGVVGFFYLG